MYIPAHLCVLRGQWMTVADGNSQHQQSDRPAVAPSDRHHRDVLPVGREGCLGGQMPVPELAEDLLSLLVLILEHRFGRLGTGHSFTMLHLCLLMQMLVDVNSTNAHLG